MKNLILMIAVLVPSFAMALDNCVMYAEIGEERPGPEITEVSTIESFAGCPDSVLVRDEFVARLLKVDRSEASDIKCVYRTSAVAFACNL